MRRKIMFLFLILILLFSNVVNASTIVTGLNPEALPTCNATLISFEGLGEAFPLYYYIDYYGGNLLFDNPYWQAATWSSGYYNGKYPFGIFTSQGDSWAFPGASTANANLSIITQNGSYISFMTTNQNSLNIKAYNKDNIIIDSGTIADNSNTGLVTWINLTSVNSEINNITIAGTANLFGIDYVCYATAPQTTTEESCSLIDLPCNLKNFWDSLVGLYNNFTDVIFGAINSIMELITSIIDFIFTLLTIFVQVIYLILTLTFTVTGMLQNTLGTMFATNVYATTTFSLILMCVFYSNFVTLWNTFIAEVSLFGFKLPKLPERK